jgi:putative ABC transport system permease protein
MKKMILHRQFLLRELVHGWRHGLLFILCVALSLTTMAALNSFKGGVDRSLFRDARELHGGDIIVHSHYPFSAALQSGIGRLEQEGRVVSTMIHEFYSVVRSSAGDNTLFAKIKAVDDNFPLYGRIELASGRPLPAVLRSGTTIVADDVLKRMKLRRGDTLLIGTAELRIVDVVVHESDSPVDFLDFGPRVFVSQDDLDTIDLVKKGSRVKYEILLKTRDENDLQEIAAALKAVALKDQERVNTFRDAGSRVKRFFDNLLFFLSLISIFTLLLAGLGMQSCLTALIRQKEKTIAITRTVGATSAFIFRHYLLIVLLLGMIGIVLGIACGAILAVSFPYLFQELLPLEGGAMISPAALVEGLVLGVMVILLFTFLPLYRLRNIKPVAIFRRDALVVSKDIVFYLVIAAGIVMVTLLVIRQLEDTTIGLLFMAGLLLFVGVISLVAALLFKGLKKQRVNQLSLRQALRSMTRAGNATRSIIVTLAAALSLLFAIYLVEHNLHRTYIESYPENAPNLFFLDIQPGQREGFLAFFDTKPPLYPIIRARLIAINGELIDRADELKKKRDNFAREFNLTYRDSLLDDEVLIEGDTLFRKSGEVDLQVSILDTVVEMGDLKVDDRLLFNIQGVELEAEVTSIRSRTKSKLYPFFYFVFPGDSLQDAPQTFFSAMHIEKDKIAALQSRILEHYPNISFINVSAAAENIGALMEKLSVIVNFFASFSILAGGLILISSILATRLARTREAVYYKILGGKTTFVYRVFMYENGLIGFFSAVVALAFAQGGSWAICHYIFEIPYIPEIGASIVLVMFTVAFVVIIGLASSLAIVRQKPARFLREHGNG